MPAACFDVRPSPSPAVPCRDNSKPRTPRKAPTFTLSPREVCEAHAQTQNACFDVPNIPGSGAAPRVLSFPSVASDTKRTGSFQQVGGIASAVVSAIACARTKKRAGQ